MSKTEMKPSSPTPSSGNTTPDVINKAATKLCHIVKRPDFDGYGFNLHSEKAKPGQFIGKVDANSPAEQAGLKEGDRIIEVNGVPINSETHKQVVQRIKAIACEVRLLLVDVEGKGDMTTANGQQQQQSNGQHMESGSKTEQVMAGVSENINSITMVSTKRPSQETPRSNNNMSNHTMNNNNGMDVTDKAVAVSPPKEMPMMMHNSTNNNTSHVPPPPSATMASANKSILMNNSSYSNNNNSSNISSSGSNMHNNSSSNGAPHSTMETAASSGSAASGSGANGNGTIKAGSLQLPMTAAEMRAKLMMKKKYDPKNESVDLKKKYEIVQKL